MAQTDLPANDFFRSLTGFDEIAITKHFGENVAVLREDPFRFMRSLVFVDLRRQGAKDVEAYRGAMEMPMADLEDYFPDQAPELDEDDPVTDQGKGVPLSA